MKAGNPFGPVMLQRRLGDEHKGLQGICDILMSNRVAIHAAQSLARLSFSEIF